MTDTLFDVDPAPARAPIGEHRKTAPPLAGRMAARARLADSDTAWEAAASISGLAAHALEAEILDAFRCCGPMTDEQLTLGPLIHRYAPTVISCRSRLFRRGLVVATGETRPTTRKRPAAVWALASSQSEVA